MYVDPYFIRCAQMLGLEMNSFIVALDLNEYKAYISKAVTFNLNDHVSPRTDFTPTVESPMPDLETNDDEDPTTAATTYALALLELPFLPNFFLNPWAVLRAVRPAG